MMGTGFCDGHWEYNRIKAGKECYYVDQGKLFFLNE